MVAKLKADNADSDICVGRTFVALNCPLSCARIGLPARSVRNSSNIESTHALNIFEGAEWVTIPSGVVGVIGEETVVSILSSFADVLIIDVIRVF